MNTDDLISQLSVEVPRVRRHAIGWRLGLGVAGGMLISLAIVVSAMGVRPDLSVAMHGFSFWMKWGYTISLSIAAVVVTAQLARPDSELTSGTFSLIGLEFVALQNTGLASDRR